MRIYPAIDIMGKQCVRLEQGQFDNVEVFSGDPAMVAKGWQNAGASFIHIVDLDGARKGSSVNNKTIARILKEVDIPIQVGGGIRNMAHVEEKINMGVARVILGTAAIKSQGFVKEAVDKYGDKIAVGIDAIEGKVAVEGWAEVSNIDAFALCMEMVKNGVKTIIYTDISKDGMMMGPNVKNTGKISAATGVDIIASGGVSSMEDLAALKALDIHGAIIGRALYNGAIKLEDAILEFERG